VSYEEMRSFDSSKNLFVDILSLICTAITFKQSYHPRDSQLLSVILSLQIGIYKGALLEIGTGQGKSVIVLILALLRAISGKSVDVVTSSRVLAKRDAEKTNLIFSIFGFDVDHNGHDETELRVASYQKTIVYGEGGDFQRGMYYST